MLIITELTENTINLIGEDSLIMIDDISYSGSQMGDLLRSIFIKNKKFNYLFILLLSLNTASLHP